MREECLQCVYVAVLSVLLVCASSTSSVIIIKINFTQIYSINIANELPKINSKNLSHKISLKKRHIKHLSDIF